MGIESHSFQSYCAMDACRHSPRELLVQASIRKCLMTKPFEFFFEMQHATLEISDHRITIRTIDQSIRNFFFEHMLAPLKNRNVIWFWHDIPQTRA